MLYRLFFILFILLLTHAHEGAARSFPSTGDVTTATEQRFGAAFQSYIVKGCIPALSATLTITIPPCRGFILDTDDPARLVGFEDTTARAITLPNTSTSFWLAARPNTTDTIPSWTCFAGTHYCVVPVFGVINQPTNQNIVVLSRIYVTGTAVTLVGDMRPDSPLPGEANLRSPLFNAVGDCVADDTVAVQTWINNMGWRRVNGYAPQGCYKISRIFLARDATNNPSFPDDTAFQGNYQIRGDGSGNVLHIAVPAQRWTGTVFDSTATDAPAFYGFGGTGAGESYLFRNLNLHGFSVRQTTTSAVIELDGVHSESSMSNIFVAQRGIGSGIVWKNTYLISLKHIFVNADNTLNTGNGIELYNVNSIGGIFNVSNVTARGFIGGTCVRIGVPTTEEEKTFASVSLIGVQGIQYGVGIAMLGAASGSVVQGAYVEGSTHHGIEIGNNALAVSVIGGYIDAFSHEDPTDAAIKIGNRDGVATGSLTDRAGAVSVIGARIVRVSAGYGIWREFSENQTNGAMLLNNIVDEVVAGTGIGIYCGATGTTTENNLVIMANSFPIDVRVGVDPSCRNGDIIQDHNGIWLGRRVNMGQGLILASAATIALPPNSNAYNLTGTATVVSIVCPACTPGAVITFFVQGGHSPHLAEGSNILLSNAAGSVWDGLGGGAISLLFDGTNWRELYRVQN